ncbi:hypothetical protein BSKO_11542 [Bryopsis sp. KO-2023]|nr:hypothetical protein BSKO_11542 [Bryopsis sp. KO-2023]
MTAQEDMMSGPGLTRTSSLDDLRKIGQQDPLDGEAVNQASLKPKPPCFSQAVQTSAQIKGVRAMSSPLQALDSPKTVSYPYGPPSYGLDAISAWPGGFPPITFGLHRQKSLRWRKVPKVSAEEDKACNEFVASCLQIPSGGLSSDPTSANGNEAGQDGVHPAPEKKSINADAGYPDSVSKPVPALRTISQGIQVSAPGLSILPHQGSFSGLYPHRGGMGWNPYLNPRLFMPGRVSPPACAPGLMPGLVPVSSGMTLTPSSAKVVPASTANDATDDPEEEVAVEPETAGKKAKRINLQKKKGKSGAAQKGGKKKRKKKRRRDSDESSMSEDENYSGDGGLDINVVPLAKRRPRRVPGGNSLESQAVAGLCEKIRSNSTEFEANGRVLRLKQYLRSDVGPAVIDAVLDALHVNTRLEALYIQNFELGMCDSQLDHLTRVLQLGRIWALNVGENFNISLEAWEKFAKCLGSTCVAYMYVSEHHLQHTPLKKDMRDAIRENRQRAPPRDPEVIKHIKNMWFNPRVPEAVTMPAGEVTSDQPVGLLGSMSGTISANGLNPSLLQNSVELLERKVSITDTPQLNEVTPTLPVERGEAVAVKQEDLCANLTAEGCLPKPPAPLQRLTHIPKQENLLEPLGPGQTAVNSALHGEKISIGIPFNGEVKLLGGPLESQEIVYAIDGGPRMQLRSSQKKPRQDGMEELTEAESEDVLAVNTSPVKSECGGGRTTFADMVNAKLIEPGSHKWTVGHEPDVEVTVQPNGCIDYKGTSFHSISSFALAVIRQRNPGRRSCDGWKDVKWNGQKMESLRDAFFKR